MIKDLWKIEIENGRDIRVLFTIKLTLMRALITRLNE